MKQQKLLKYADMSKFFLVTEKKNISVQKKKVLIREFIRIVEQNEKEETEQPESESDDEGGIIDSALDYGKEGFGDYAILALVQFLLSAIGVPKDSFLGTYFANAVKNFAKRGFDFADIYEMFSNGEYEKIADIIIIDLEDAIVQRIIESFFYDGGRAEGLSGVVPGTIQEMIKNGIKDSGIVLKIKEMIIGYLKDFDIGDIGSVLKSAAGGALDSIANLFS